MVKPEAAVQLVKENYLPKDKASHGMNVLSIGSDRDILDRTSSSAMRQATYGTRFESLSIIVFSLKRQRYMPLVLSEGVHAYPTASKSRLLFGLDAFLIARKLPRPDVVTAQDPFEIGLIGLIVARLWKSAFHVQVHTDFLAPAYRENFLGELRVMLARFVLRRADRVRVVSFRIEEGIERARMTEAPVTVLPIFVDVRRFRATHAGTLAGRFSRFRRRLLVVARLEKEKNVGLALESFAKLASKDVCLIIVGEGREKQRLQKMAKRMSASSSVFFEGKTDPLPYYAVADLVLVPSRYEGYGMVIVEALAAGKPVLSTDVGVARESGAIISDEAHFADSLVEIVRDGAPQGQLQHYPYDSFESYVDAYCKDIEATVRI